jgi:uncharacterized membrane protein
MDTTAAPNLSANLGAAWLLGQSALGLLALGLAGWLRPWRMLGPGGPPWPWLLLWALLPLCWLSDRWSQLPAMPLASGAVLLVLLAGWPLTVLALLPAALATAWIGDLAWAEAIGRAIWLGLVPATLALLIGAGVRRCLPRQLFGYLLGRAFLGTLLALLLAGWAALALQPPAGAGELGWADRLAAQVLVAFGEASLTGMLATLLVALQPGWLATYADRLYLPTMAAR